MIDRENAAFIQTGVAISLATGAVDRLPNHARALGCKLVDAEQRLAIFVRSSQSQALLANIRDCFDGVIPGLIATCDADGVPNMAYLSQVQFIDLEHVALSYQFFNKTRQNVLLNPKVRLLLTSHLTACQYRLSLHYLRTETAGPLFEQMKAKLAGIASHTGMSGVFKLLGSDVYRILAIERVPGATLAAPPPLVNYLTALRRSTARLASCEHLETLLDTSLDCLSSEFGIQHLMLLMHDEAGQRLYTLASHGYPASGVGSEIPIGAGVIGVCARERTPIRIGYTASEYAYGRAIRESAAADGLSAALESAIPLPGLPEAASQLAVPITAFDRLLGVFYVESTADQHFGYDDEDALVAFAAQLGMAIHHQQAADTAEEPAATEPATRTPAGKPLTVRRHFSGSDSVFLDDDYLIKGVAGAILWALVRDHVERGRTSFSNKELRIDPRIRLPGVSDNLEARLLLLQRRLDERPAGITLVKTRRGRFALCVKQPLQLVAA
ncbi:MAG: GAF domain-containing protein [Candidatus Accumulibacter meliphilus]|jgi:adenylate cyclase|uniref:GAF domain-containing protein n=1 Tax=Candidatus Accumulibacter meliphilus TaxID=2211374 RepID=A0A369XVB3_9PROT|nr:MAG: GAF domain-containing protein [Candidatus Accumulibacter meliphilus]